MDTSYTRMRRMLRASWIAALLGFRAGLGSV